MNRSDENRFNADNMIMGDNNKAKVQECIRVFEGDNASSLSKEEAYQALIEEANKGNLSAMFWLGVIHEQEKEYASAKCSFEWFLKAARLGNSDAQFQVAYHYLHGIYVDTNNHEAYKWYQDSARQGNPHSQNSLGTMYLRNQISIEDDSDLREQYEEKSNAKGWEWLMKAASQRHYAGLCNLAGMYLNGVYVNKDEDTAASLYRLAVEVNTKNTRAIGMLEKMGVAIDMTDLDRKRLIDLFSEGFIQL